MRWFSKYLENSVVVNGGENGSSLPKLWIGTSFCASGHEISIRPLFCLKGQVRILEGVSRCFGESDLEGLIYWGL